MRGCFALWVSGALLTFPPTPKFPLMSRKGAKVINLSLSSILLPFNSKAITSLTKSFWDIVMRKFVTLVLSDEKILSALGLRPLILSDRSEAFFASK